MKKIKTVAVLFSSGLDSTYLMYENLEVGNHVLPIYVEIKNNINKSIVEKQNAKMLVSLFQKTYNKNKVDNLKIVSEILVNGNSHLLLEQVPVWIFGMLYTSLNDIDEIHIGYVGNDDALSYLNDIRRIYKSYSSLVQKGKMPKLKFPLMKKKKYEMMNDLPKIYKPYISSCENPNLKSFFIKPKNQSERLQMYEPCGNCVPCKRIIKDNLSYNQLYDKLIHENYESDRMGREFFQIKKKHPSIFENVQEKMYREIDVATNSKELT